MEETHQLILHSEGMSCHLTPGFLGPCCHFRGHTIALPNESDARQLPEAP